MLFFRTKSTNFHAQICGARLRTLWNSSEANSYGRPHPGKCWLRMYHSLATIADVSSPRAKCPRDRASQTSGNMPTWNQ
jgi:hypothetical protein